ncbi:flagellar hook-basal body complex protein [Novosphingobium sp. FSY-8]|uniref:Flagellar hook protein FlgE n=1 Tax=Novosphingobium ovatum TaxID=1908523 RepID=A0ABW9XG19_9SPHN|nr:flagellar hook basal-body protein [Novosphingobium ovatum]NBC37495.1 flagellar hook-basal body complex protein [Novosphingobium ovatum]
MAFYTSLNGLRNAQTELNTISNNLANAETTGFKKSRVNFSDIVAGSAYSNPKLVQGIGSMVKTIDQNFASGAIMSTGSALDLAVNGEGFFAVTSPVSGDTLYTRNGNFTTDNLGNIVDQNGNRLQILAYSGGSFATTVSDGVLSPTNGNGGNYSAVQIKTDGTIIASYSDGTVSTVGKVALASFVSPGGLLQVGNQDWQATGLSGAATYAAPDANGLGNILSGSLEQSNVDMSEEMVSLITAQRFFQANAKAIDTSTAVADAVINLRS